MSGRIPYNFTRPESDDLRASFAAEEVIGILEDIQKDHSVKFANWVYPYTIFHWFHKRIRLGGASSHLRHRFQGAEGLQLLENILRSCTVCAAQQGDFDEQKRLYGFVQKIAVPADTSSDSD